MLNKFSEYYEKNIKPYEKGYNDRIKKASKNDKVYRKKESRYDGISFICSIFVSIILCKFEIFNYFIHAIAFLVVQFLFAYKTLFNSFDEDIIDIRKEIKDKIIKPLIKTFCLEEYKDYNNKDIVLRSDFWPNITFSSYLVGDTIFIDEGFMIGEVKFPGENNSAFVGIIVSYDIKEYFTDELILKIVDKSNVNKIEYKELEKINLENIEFNKYFDVYASKQIAARMILTISFMEKLVEIKKIFNRNININVHYGKLYLTINDMYIFDEERIIKNGLSEGELYYNIKNIEQTITLIKNIFNSI